MIARMRLPRVLLAAAALSTAAVTAGGQQPERDATNASAARLRGFEQHQAMARDSRFKDVKWQFIGPKNMSGRCTDVAVVAPRGKNYTIYAATASGGLWKTENEATTWMPAFDQAPATTIGDVAIAPSDPRIVWMGTGEANIYRSSQAGIGVYKSTDAGKTWAHMGLADTQTIARIVVHPANPDIVYVAASGHEWTPNAARGVFKTTDGGKSWQLALGLDEQTGAIDLAMDPADPETLYAATWQRTRLKWNDPRTFAGYKGSGIHKTTDGGRTWRAIDSALPPASQRGRIGLDVCLTKPNVLYALVDNYEIARQPTAEEKADPYGLPSSGFIRGATVYRSDDKGETWTQVSGQTPEQKRFMERVSGTYGWVFGQVRVDPNDPNRVYVLAVELNVSNDGGRTFKALETPGSDHHGMWIDPANSDYLVIAYDQGFAISYDRGATWKTSDLNLPVVQFFDVAYDLASPFHVYGSAQDHGSFRGLVDLSNGRSAIHAVDFEQAPGGEGSTHAVDATDPCIVYSSGFYGTLTRTDLACPAPKREGAPARAGGASCACAESGRRNACEGQREKKLLPARYPDEPPLRGQWLAPTILSPHNPQIVYHGMQYLMMSRDRGDTWTVASPDLTRGAATEKGDVPYHTLTAISESPLRFGLVYAGTDDGRLHLTKDGGKTWVEVSAGLAGGKWVSRVAASAFDVGTVYAAQNGKRDDDFSPYLWKSTDFGKTWQSIAAGIPIGPVNVIREDPVNKDILYVGTDMGVYVSTDAGRRWSVLGAGLPTTYVHDLVVHPRDNVIVIATHGRGMWALDATPVNGKGEPRRTRNQKD